MAKGGGYESDLSLLERLVAIPLQAAGGGTANTGALANAVDIWIATELRRAGIDPDAVWPRATQPRVLSRH